MKKFRRISILVLVLIMAVTITACKKDGGEESSAPTTTAQPTTKAPETSAPATSAEEPTDNGEKIVNTVDSFTSFYSIGEGNAWFNTVNSLVNSLGDANTGKQYASFYVTPAIDNVNGSINFADSDTEVSDLEGLAIRVRMNEEGYFDAINGGDFGKVAEVGYTGGNGYTVEIFADMGAKTYTVYVTAPESERTMIAEDFAFSTTAADTDDLGNMFIINVGEEDEQITVDTFRRFMLYDSEKFYLSTGENFGWQERGIHLGREYTGKIRITWDMTKLIDSVDASVDFTDGEIDVFGFDNLAMLVRMDIDSGMFDVRNVAKQERIADVSVEKDKVYHIEIVADIDAKLYDVWVTPDGGEKVKVAENYGFRSAAATADSIAKAYVISAHEDNSMRMENLVIEEIN
ncbi:MAG: hypothetical protein PHV32_06690 [Eubacteriales bacterium]|nr:hypothetical protein [Eubacteriales bacterium]